MDNLIKVVFIYNLTLLYVCPGPLTTVLSADENHLSNLKLVGGGGTLTICSSVKRDGGKEN